MKPMRPEWGSEAYVHGGTAGRANVVDVAFGLVGDRAQEHLGHRARVLQHRQAADQLGTGG